MYTQGHASFSEACLPALCSCWVLRLGAWPGPWRCLRTIQDTPEALALAVVWGSTSDQYTSFSGEDPGELWGWEGWSPCLEEKTPCAWGGGAVVCHLPSREPPFCWHHKIAVGESSEGKKKRIGVFQAFLGSTWVSISFLDWLGNGPKDAFCFWGCFGCGKLKELENHHLVPIMLQKHHCLFV